MLSAPTCAKDESIRMELGAGQSNRGAGISDLGDETARPGNKICKQSQSKEENHHLRSEKAQCWSVDVVRT